MSDKIEVIENLLKKVDRLIIGGAMAYTFFKSRGMPVGKSLVEDDKLDAARRLRPTPKARGVDIELPVDHVVTERIDAAAPHQVLAIGDPAIGDRLGVDIGPATIKAYTGFLPTRRPSSGTARWGSSRSRRSPAAPTPSPDAVSRVQGTTIIGGGDSIAAVKKAGIADRITHISTGGGASLEFLGGRTLPGVAALAEK